MQGLRSSTAGRCARMDCKGRMAAGVRRSRACVPKAVVVSPATGPALSAKAKLPATHLESSLKALEQLKLTAVDSECRDLAPGDLFRGRAPVHST